MNTLQNIEPQEIWKHFAALNAVPRPSKKEERVIAFAKEFGERLGLPTRVDAVGNVIIEKPATLGMEDRETVVLQSHLDMVCQKNNGVDFDFETQGIEMYVEEGWVKAKGTTLGADNGIGVAAIMAILASENIPHPAIEALFTIDEETGMTGAKGLKENELKGKILLNLDTEEDDEIDIGCAGGIDVTAKAQFQLVSCPAEGLEIKISGLQGGHSGMDIHKGFGNANVLLGRLLFESLTHHVQLQNIQGGGLRNAIPREAVAHISVADVNAAQFQLKALAEDLYKEYQSVEKDIKIEIHPVQLSGQALSAEDSKKIILALTAAHNGVFRMSPDVEDLVEASNNIARVELHEGALEIQCLTRSSVESSKWNVVHQLTAAFQLARLEVKTSGDYPGWKPKPQAPIVKTMTEMYEKCFGEKPRVVACHAGLECGIIGGSHPEMEMVSFGPNIRGAHSPDEKVEIASVQKFWRFLKEVLANIPHKTQ